MASVILRRNKTSPLTHDEMDDNIANLNNLKAEQSVVDGKAPLSASTASGTSNVPAGGITETNVQGALNGLEARKAPLANPVFSGKVGIGVTPTTSRLAVYNASGHAATFYGAGYGFTLSSDTSYGVTLTGNMSNGAAEENIVYGTSGGGLWFSGWNGATRTEQLKLDSVGNTLHVNPNGGLGYGPGAGGTVTQATSKSTAVALSKPSGKITTASDALAAGATAIFTLANSLVTANDSVVITQNWGSSTGSDYDIKATTYLGNIIFFVKNVSAGALAQAVIFNFEILKGTIA